MPHSNLHALPAVWLANMYPVPPPDTHHLNAAIGWLALGNLREAGVELRFIRRTFRHHPDVLAVRLDVCAEQGRWQDMVRLAEMLIGVQSQAPAGWIQRSFALDQLERTGEALEKLVPAAERFPAEPMIPFNLACYASKLAQPRTAWEFFERALECGPAQLVRDLAALEPDLVGLWSYLEEAGSGS